MEKSRKELLKEEIERYKELIKKIEKRKEVVNPYEIEAMNSFIEGYNKQIEMDVKEIEELTRKENVDCLSGISKLKAIQWYLREDKGFLLSDGGFRILDIGIDGYDEVVIKLKSGDEIVVDIHELFDKMLNEKRRAKIQILLNEIFKKIAEIEELAYDREIESIRDTILEAF